jgi:DNA ligase-1
MGDYYFISFATMIERLEMASGSNDKKKILKDFPENQLLLKYTLNPDWMFGVTSAQITDIPSQGDKHISWGKAQPILDKLVARELTGHAAVDAIRGLLNGITGREQEVFLRLLDKDLKVGVAVSLVNKVFKGLIEVWNVKLCETLEEFDKLPFEKTYVSRKLDGVRVEAVKYDETGFRFFSRKGKEFKTLGVLKEALDHTYQHIPTTVLCGECCIIDENGNEDFTAIVSEIKRKDHTIANPHFKIFDVLTLEEFEAAEGSTTFEQRYNHAVEVFAEIDNKFFSLLEQKLMKSVEELTDSLTEAGKLEWEGLIGVNGDAFYEGKRTWNLLKMKAFQEAEFTVVGVYEGEDSFKGTLGGFNLEGEWTNAKKQTFKIKSNCGSGFKEPERHALWAMDHESFKGQIATIRFFQVSQNKKSKIEGYWSLRFPTFKVLHGFERTL